MPPPNPTPDITRTVMNCWSKNYESLRKSLYLFRLFWIPVKREVSWTPRYAITLNYKLRFLPVESCFEVQNLDMYIVSSKYECVTYTNVHVFQSWCQYSGIARHRFHALTIPMLLVSMTQSLSAASPHRRLTARPVPTVCIYHSTTWSPIWSA